MKYKVIKEFGCAKKGDVLEQNNNMWGLRVEENNSTRELFLNDQVAQDFVDEGYLQEFEDCCCESCQLEAVLNFVDEKLEQYKQDYDAMIESYNEQEIPTCVKVEAETVYYNMTKLLNSIKEIIEK